jgi:hypothetical protein
VALAKGVEDGMILNKDGGEKGEGKRLSLE